MNKINPSIINNPNNTIINKKKIKFYDHKKKA